MVTSWNSEWKEVTTSTGMSFSCFHTLILIAPFAPSISISVNASVKIQMGSGRIQSVNASVNTDAWCEHSLTISSEAVQMIGYCVL